MLIALLLVFGKGVQQSGHDNFHYYYGSAVIVVFLAVGFHFLARVKKNAVYVGKIERILILLADQPTRVLLGRLFNLESRGYPVLRVLKDLEKKGLLKQYREYLLLRIAKIQLYISETIDENRTSDFLLEQGEKIKEITDLPSYIKPRTPVLDVEPPVDGVNSSLLAPSTLPVARPKV